MILEPKEPTHDLTVDIPPSNGNYRLTIMGRVDGVPQPIVVITLGEVGQPGFGES